MNLFWSESTLHAKTNKNAIKKIIEGAEEAEKLVGNRVTTKEYPVLFVTYNLKSIDSRLAMN